MILIWLGSFAIMVFGVVESRKQLAQLCADFKKKIIEKGFSGSFAQMLVHAIDVVIVEVSPRGSSQFALNSQHQGILSVRPAYLILCLGSLGAWWTLVLGLLYLNFNGYFLLGLSVLGLLNLKFSKQFEAITKLLFATGLFCIGGELTLRNSSIIHTFLGESDLAFFIADGRFGPELALILFGFVLDLMFRIEYLSFFLSLCLLSNNTISFNGAAGIIAGAALANTFTIWRECRAPKVFSTISSLGILVGFYVAGEFRVLFSSASGFDISLHQDRNFQLVAVFSIILLFQFLAQMAWGHFACKKGH